MLSASLSTAVTRPRARSAPAALSVSTSAALPCTTAKPAAAARWREFSLLSTTTKAMPSAVNSSAISRPTRPKPQTM